jgi:hypothetical protein
MKDIVLYGVIQTKFVSSFLELYFIFYKFLKSINELIELPNKTNSLFSSSLSMAKGMGHSVRQERITSADRGRGKGNSPAPCSGVRRRSGVDKHGAVGGSTYNSGRCSDRARCRRRLSPEAARRRGRGARWRGR